MKIFTIGFTQKSAEAFFGKLQRAGVRRVVDTRLHNTSQLSGFAKRDDLRFFLDAIGNMGYLHEPLLAPSDDMLADYKKKRIDWRRYESRFLALMREREIEKRMDRALIDRGCLLCSEAKPHYCHRRLVAEYLQNNWGDVEIIHLV
ncbi:DUF488 domain-containing protein [Nitrolancea hollandica]|nr:DUF488 domain-containing protein [Nitrolancea hollandica]